MGFVKGPYSEIELSILKEEFEKGTNLIDLEKILQRPHGGIVQKLLTLYNEDRTSWSKETIRDYFRQFYYLHQEEIATYRNSDKIKTYQADYKYKNKEKIKRANKDYHQENKDEILKRKRIYKRNVKLAKALEACLS